MENSYREALTTLELFIARQKEIKELAQEQRKLNRDEQIRYFARKDSKAEIQKEKDV